MKQVINPASDSKISLGWLYGSLSIAIVGTLLQTVILRLDYTHNFLDFLMLGAGNLYWPLFLLALVPGYYFMVAKRDWRETVMVSLLAVPAFSCTTNLIAPQAGNFYPLLNPDTPHHIALLTIRYTLTLFSIIILSRLLVRTARRYIPDQRTIAVFTIMLSGLLFGLTIAHHNYQADKSNRGSYSQQP